MEQLPHAKGFWELIVYQRARELQRQVFECSKHFPKAETYSLTDQMRRAARSIGAQIAEAWGKRAYEKHFVSKLSDAVSETFETQHWISDNSTSTVREASTEWFSDQASIVAA